MIAGNGNDTINVGNNSTVTAGTGNDVINVVGNGNVVAGVAQTVSRYRATAR